MGANVRAGKTGHTPVGKGLMLEGAARPGGKMNDTPKGVDGSVASGVEMSRPGKGEGGVGGQDSMPMRPGPGGSQATTMHPRQSPKVKV